MNRSVRVLVGILLVLLLLAGAAGGFFWWKVSTLKDSLARDLGQALGAKVEVASLDLDLWKGELHAAGISLTNERPEAPWDKGAIAQATVHFHLSDLFSPSLPLTVDVSDWSVVLHSYTSSVVPPDTTATTTLPTSPSSSASPARSHAVRVTDLQAREGTVEIHLYGDNQVVMHQVEFKASDNGAGLWTTDLKTAAITSGTLTASSGSVHLQGDKDKVDFSDLRMACDQGFINGHGEVGLVAPHQSHIVLKATGLPIAMLLASPWQMKITGNVNGDVTYDSDDQTATAMGHLSLDQSKFNVLPWLGKITALVSLPDFSNVELDQATSDFTWKEHVFHFTNVDLRKTDVARIAGTVDVTQQGLIDGKLRLGLPSPVTAKWPDLQDKVFSVTSDGYNWADVHVTGTADDLHEDLTSRVAATAVQGGTDLIQQTTNKAAEILKNFLGN